MKTGADYYFDRTPTGGCGISALDTARATTNGYQPKDFARFVRWKKKGAAGRRRKKTAAAVHQEITLEINLLLTRIFAERHKTGDVDNDRKHSVCKPRSCRSTSTGSTRTEFLVETGQDLADPRNLFEFFALRDAGEYSYSSTSGAPRRESKS